MPLTGNWEVPDQRVHSQPGFLRQRVSVSWERGWGPVWLEEMGFSTVKKEENLLSPETAFSK